MVTKKGGAYNRRGYVCDIDHTPLHPHHIQELNWHRARLFFSFALCTLPYALQMDLTLDVFNKTQVALYVPPHPRKPPKHFILTPKFCVAAHAMSTQQCMEMLTQVLAFWCHLRQDALDKLDIKVAFHATTEATTITTNTFDDDDRHLHDHHNCDSVCEDHVQTHKAEDGWCTIFAIEDDRNKDDMPNDYDTLAAGYKKENPYFIGLKVLANLGEITAAELCTSPTRGNDEGKLACLPIAAKYKGKEIVDNAWPATTSIAKLGKLPKAKTTIRSRSKRCWHAWLARVWAIRTTKDFSGGRTMRIWTCVKSQPLGLGIQIPNRDGGQMDKRRFGAGRGAPGRAGAFRWTARAGACCRVWCSDAVDLCGIF